MLVWRWIACCVSTLSANMMVAVCDSRVCVKLTGRANFTSSVDFKALVNELQARGHRSFALDLTECLAMDSTFLGVLAGFVQRLTQCQDGAGEIQLWNANPRITDFLDNLGVLSLFRLATGDVNAQYVAVKSADASKELMSQTCLEAHEALMEINPANVPRFKDVARFLAEELKKPAR